MKKMISLLILFTLILACKNNEKPNLIKYQVLREWKPKNGIGMELLVNENATKEEIMKLAKHLRKNYESLSFLSIDIFDSREAWENRENLNYPEEEYSKHWLVNMVRNKNTGYDEIKWVAIGREN